MNLHCAPPYGAVVYWQISDGLVLKDASTGNTKREAISSFVVFDLRELHVENVPH